MDDKTVLTWLVGAFIVLLLAAFWLKGQQSSGGATCGQYATTGECY